MFTYILVAVALIFALCLIYWAANNTNGARRRRALDALDQSAGVYDGGARRALDEYAEITDLTVEDHFARAGILRYNLLNGDIRRAGGRRAVGQITADMIGALGGMVDEPVNDPEFMVHDMEVFGQQLNDWAGMGADPNINQHMALEFANVFAVAAPAIRQTAALDRRARAVAAAGSRAEAATLALDDAVTYTNDRQNVHDGKVNNDLRATLRTLRMDAGRGSNHIDIPTALDDAEDYILRKYAKEYPEKVAAARQTLARVRTGEAIGTFNDTEDNIFAHVWERSKHPRNRANRDLMQEAAIHALADSVERGEMVCINGRTGRVLNSLVTLDHNKSVGEVMTYEAYRNQIFQETKTIIDQEIDRAKSSLDNDMRVAAEAYETGDEADTAVFTSALKTEIAAHVDSYSEKLNDTERNTIKAECNTYAIV